MENLEKFISESLEEDIKNGDITSLSCIEKSKSTSAELISKDEGIIAGIELAKQIFEFNSTNLLFTRLAFWNKISYNSRWYGLVQWMETLCCLE